MTLTEQQWRLVIFCLGEERQARLRGKTPGFQPWNDELIEAACRELAEMSRQRQSDDAAPSDLNRDNDSDLSSRQVAEMTGWHIRKVQRNRKKLGGQKIGTSLVFHERDVLEHIEGSTA